MAGLGYPTNIDASYADPTTEAGDHQRYHDGVHRVANRFDDSAGTAGQVLMWDGPSGLWLAHTLLSTDNPGIVGNSQSGTTYTLVLGDAGKLVEATNAAAVTITVPPNSSVAFAVGTVVGWRQYGAGQVTFAAGAGVTLRSQGSAFKAAGQYAEGTITKRATDEWVLSGNTTV